jgi:hypothetical protein
MANKKQQKRRQDRRKAGTNEIREPEVLDEPDEDASSPGYQAGGGANPERREQKEAVRRQKERQLRRIQRNDMLKKVGVAALVIAIVGGGIYYISSQRSEANSEVEALLARAGEAKEAAGCSDIEVIPPMGATETEDSAHVEQMPPLSQYNSTPPASGPHDSSTEQAGVYQESPAVLGSVLHSMEHGAVVVWYRPGEQSGAEFAEIEDFVERNQDHVILAPYEYPDEGTEGGLPKGVNMSLTAWHHQQTCEELSLPVIAQFMSEYRTPTLGGGPYEGDAPEQNALI